MTISVITPSLNVARTVGDTLASVASQTHKILEYVVVDGHSTDGTLELVAAWKDRLPIRIISESPRGVYAAMNTGLRIVRGDIVAILNADDRWYDEQVLQRVVDAFQEYPDAAIVYGDILYSQSEFTRTTRRWRAGEYREQKVSTGWAMPHPAVFVRRSVYERYGVFNESFKIAGDYEIMIRWLLIHRVPVRYISSTLAVMAPGGRSANGLRQRIRGWQELRRAWVIQGRKPPISLIPRRVFGKLTQFF